MSLSILSFLSTVQLFGSCMPSCSKVLAKIKMVYLTHCVHIFYKKRNEQVEGEQYGGD